MGTSHQLEQRLDLGVGIVVDEDHLEVLRLGVVADRLERGARQIGVGMDRDHDRDIRVLRAG